MAARLNRRQFVARTAMLASAATLPMPAVAQNAPVKIGLLTVKTGPLAAGGVHIEEGITAYLKDKNFTLSGRKIDLIVSDTGEGIAADELPHVFDRFHQVDRAHTRRHGGLGLGLAIVRHLVEAHRGTVHAASAGRGRGAAFTVRLPDVGDTQAVTAIMPARPATAERLLVELAVLFVDDNPEARALVRTVLEGAGADVSVAASAADALAVLEQTHVEIVLTDIGMPGLDGYDFVMRLREIERAAGRPPVCAIALTAHAGAEDRRRALTGGFQGYLAKPIDPDELVRATYAVYLEASRR